MIKAKKYFYYLALFIFILTIPSLILYIFYTKSKPIRTLDLLIKATKEHRFTEARLSQGFSCGQLQRPSSESDKNSYINRDSFLLTKNISRGNNENTNKSTISLSNVALTIYTDLIKSKNPENLYNLALLNILEGRYTEAISGLENILTLQKNSLLLNDLAVTYLERGDTQNRPGDLFHALSLIDEVINIDDSLLEAKFNRALILEKLYLNSQAQSFWQEYINLEKNLDWKKEALDHLATLEKISKVDLWTEAESQLELAFQTQDIEKARTITKTFPHLARTYVLEKIIPQWANLVENRNLFEADKLIPTAQIIGQVLFEIQGDKGVTYAIEVIIKTSSNPKKLETLAFAHNNYNFGKKALDKSNSDEAKAFFEKALISFSLIKDENSKAWTIFQLARYKIVASKYQEAISDLKKITKFAQEQANLYLLARSFWVIGLTQDYQAEFSSSLESKYLALKHLEKAKDAEGIAVINSLIAATLMNIQKLDDASSHLYKSLINISKIDNSKWQFNINREICIQLYRLDEIRAASYFYKELNLLANKDENQTKKFLVLLETCSLYQKLPNDDLALTYLNAARQELEKITDPSFHQSAEQLLLITEAQYYLNDSPSRVIEILDKLETILPKDDQLYKTTILRLRAKAFLALKQYDQAEETLKTNIDAFESQRSKITNESYRLSFFEEPQAVYEDMIKFQINQRQNLDLAFDYVELARSRALLDTIGGQAKTIKSSNAYQEVQLIGTSKPFTLKEIQPNLPNEVTLIRYLIVSDQVYIWLVTKNKVELVKQKINETELEKQIFQLCTVITDFKSESANIEAAITPVYKAIFEPIKPYLQQMSSQSNLVIIPDKSLFAVPFAALIDKETKRYLIEDYSILTSSSATVYVLCLKHDRQMLKHEKEKVLAIGNPTFSKEHFPNMRYLSGAKEEAEIIANLYPDSTFLPEDKATKEIFLAEATKYDVIHYSGHALVDPVSPLFSKLLLATPKNAPNNYDEALYAHEIYSKNFTNTRLVVLAACKTAGGLPTHSEGIISMARPFLSRGVPSVVASLWDADDKVSVKLFEEFHRQRLAGKDLATAMRMAQLKLLKDKYLFHPRFWSLFQVIGGSSPK